MEVTDGLGHGSQCSDTPKPSGCKNGAHHTVLVQVEQGTTGSTISIDVSNPPWQQSQIFFLFPPYPKRFPNQEFLQITKREDVIY
jgi:hypothetical protein